MKKLFALILALSMLVSLSGCISIEVAPPQGQSSQPTQPYQPSQPSAPQQTVTPQSSPAVSANTGDADYEWAFYWYLCGSNLESDGACATYDLQELLAAKIPDNVVFVIETGGAKTWRNNLMSSSKLQRWVYSSEGLELVDERPRANMGDAETLGEFLEFAKNNYPAEKAGLIFWNHGGGSVAGAAFDEIYNYDSLTLNEMYAAIGGVFGADPDNPPLELVGFDTCLMATIDVAYTFSELAHYLVASEESEPGNGWYYTDWVKALANDPSMDGAKLGKEICDAFVTGCQKERTQDSITLSVTDLSKLEPLLDAYESFGADALVSAVQNNRFLSEFGRAANNSENYGGNTKSQGYTNMVDLGDLARNTGLSTADAVLDALGDCVLYKVNGRYRSNSTGLACYYAYDGSTKSLSAYSSMDESAGEALKYFYEYGLTGRLGSSGQNYLKQLQANGGVPQTVKPESLPGVDTIKTMKWDGIKVQLDKKTGTSYIYPGEKANDVLQSVCFELFYFDEKLNLMVNMGYDNDIQADWDNGIFADNFRGVWGAIDGTPVYMELSNITGSYNLYSVPILLNKEQYNLQVAYDFETEQWYVLGARKGLDSATGMSAKELRQLELGDEITVLWKVATYSGDDDFEYYTVGTVSVNSHTTFGEADLFNGKYAMVYEMTDVQGNVGLSNRVIFTVKDGEISTTVEN